MTGEASLRSDGKSSQVAKNARFAFLTRVLAEVASEPESMVMAETKSLERLAALGSSRVQRRLS